MNDIVVSVIIPVYNAEKYIERAVDSVLNQTFHDYEIILVNDGSTDKSREIIDNIASQYENIACLHVDNGGPSKARNIGMSVARGEFIQFMDADDYIDSDMLESYSKVALEQDAVCSGAIRELINKQTSDYFNLPKICLKSQSDISNYARKVDSKQHNLLLNYIWNKWYRKSVIDRHDIRFDENIKLGEDYLFNCKFFKCVQKICLIEKSFYHYCLNDYQSLVFRFTPNERELQDGMDAALKDLCVSLGIYPECEGRLQINSGRCYYNSIFKIGKIKSLTFAEQNRFIESFLHNDGNHCITKYILSLPKSRKIKNIPVLIASFLGNVYLMKICVYLREKK